MCGDSSVNHKVLGQRLSQSQGFRPKKKTGISVSVMECSNCGLVYTSHQPIPLDIQDHYGNAPESYWKPEYFHWNKNYFLGVINHVKSIIDFKEGMLSLDIGAGLGKSMLSMKYYGFDPYGVEPSVTFRERAIEKMDIPADRILLGKVEDVDFENEMFDFISFGAVFEHLYDPAYCLQRTLNWLKKDGVIQIEVPSARWLMTRVMNDYFRLIGTNYVTNLSPMHEPFHMHEFTLESFEKLSKKLGFELVDYRFSEGTIYHIPKFLHRILKWHMRRTKTGMQLTVYLRKRS